MAAMYFVHKGSGGREGPYTLPQLQVAFASGHVHDNTLVSTAEDPAALVLEERPSLRAKMPMHGKASWATELSHIRSSPSKTLPLPPPPLTKRCEVDHPAENNDARGHACSDCAVDASLVSVQQQNQTSSNQFTADAPSNQEPADVPLAWWANPIDGYKLVRIEESQPPNLVVRGLDDPTTAVVVAESAVIKLESPPPPPMQVDNLVHLYAPGEWGVLHCLKQRFLHQQIYTNVGKLLVSINPFQKLPAPEVQLQAYTQAIHADLPPHVYQVAAAAFESALRFATSQSIVISGESGSGKSEVTKLCMQYFSSVTGQSMDLEGMLLACSPILDAFGNATTIHNSNSSRFGKLLQLQLNESGKIDGCAVTAYLLEKSRLTRVEGRERNYHIFYQLCANMDKSSREFALLGELAPTSDDKDAFQVTMAALDAFHFTASEKDGIVAICRGILHLGNVVFGDDKLLDQVSLQEAASALQCEPQALATRLTVRRLKVRGECMDMPLVGESAVSNRDSLVKALYTRLFNWLIRRINDTMMAMATTPRSHLLLVDIFGFESFGRNGFEQLCINFANEKLQQMFHTVVFDEALDRYRQEGLDVPGLSVPYKQLEVLEVLDSKPKGIFALLDDEVSIPKSSEYSLHSKLVTAHAKSPAFKAGKATLTFTLMHYAQPVTYDCGDLLAKNKDHVADDVVEFCQQDCMPLLQEMAPTAAPTRGDATISATFRRQLKELLARLQETSIHFIRCIKPNHDQIPGVVDGPYVLDQLRQMGILKALELHHGGLHPFQETHALFYQSYRFVAARRSERTGQNDAEKSMADKCRDLVQQLPTPSAFSVGSTSVFSSLEMHQWLRRERAAAEGAAVAVLQRGWRRMVWRRACRQLGQSSVLLVDVASTDDGLLRNRVEQAKALLQLYPSHHLSRRLRQQCVAGETHLDRHRRQDELLVRIQQPRHDIDAMEADLALCEKWHLRDNPHVIAFTALYTQLHAERQMVVQVTRMLRAKVLDVATVESALRSPMMSAVVAERARAALQEISSEPRDVDILASAIALSTVSSATLQSKFATWSSARVDEAVTSLEQRAKWSSSLHANLELCANLGKLRATLRAMTQHTVMEGLATLKGCLALAVPSGADARLAAAWQAERTLARQVVDDYDRMHKLLAKAWLCKVPQEAVFLDLCDQMVSVSLQYGISFDPTLVSEAQTMLASIRQEKMFQIEVESLIAVCPDFAAKTHVHIDRLRHLAAVFPLPPLYDKTEIASNVCLFLLKLRSATKKLFECTTLVAVDAAWSAVQAILHAGHHQFDLLASDKWFRTMAHALEMEQQAATQLADFKRASVRVGKALHLAMASSSYDGINEALVQVDQLHLDRDYTLRDLVLRAKDVVQTSKNIRHELRHAIDTKALDALEPALEKATRLQVHSRLVQRASRLLKDLKHLELEFALCQFDTHTERLEAFVRHCDHMRLPTPARTRAGGLLHLSRDKFLQEQLKWALQQNAPPHDVLELTLALKHEFFEHSGSLFDMQNFPRLREATMLQPMASPSAPSYPRVLATALTELDPAEAKVAVKISKAIHGYLGNDDLYRLRHARFLVRTGLLNRRLADEIYVQLVQQLLAIHGIDLGRATQAWALMHVCVATFAPSDGCWNYLEYFLRRHNKLPLVAHLHAAKPPALTQPSMATLYRIIAPSLTAGRTDGWAKITQQRQTRRRRKWLVLEGTMLYVFKDDSYKRDAVAAISILDVDDIQSDDHKGAFSIALSLRTSRADKWTLHLDGHDDHSTWHHAIQEAKAGVWGAALFDRGSASPSSAHAPV